MSRRRGALKLEACEAMAYMVTPAPLNKAASVVTAASDPLSLWELVASWGEMWFFGVNWGFLG